MTDDEREVQIDNDPAKDWHAVRCGHNFVIRHCPYLNCEARANALALDETRAEITQLKTQIEDGRSESRVKLLTNRLYRIPTNTEEATGAIIEASDILLMQSREIARPRVLPSTDATERAENLVWANPLVFPLAFGAITRIAHAIEAARADGIQAERERREQEMVVLFGAAAEYQPSAAALEFAHDQRWPNDRIDVARLCDAFGKAERAKVLAMLREPSDEMIDAMRAIAAPRLDLPIGITGEREKYRRRIRALAAKLDEPGTRTRRFVDGHGDVREIV